MTATTPSWQGINHLALITDDMDSTVRFWHEVLGAELVAHLATPSFRHYFFRVGDAQTVAFFEYLEEDLQTFAKPAGVPFEKATQFDHLSLGLPDLEALEDLRRRLKEHDCEVTEIVDHGFIKSVYFMDPTGIALEASCWTVDLDDDRDRLMLDRDPVPAVRELTDDGRITQWPSTQLVDEVVVDPA